MSEGHMLASWRKTLNIKYDALLMKLNDMYGGMMKNLEQGKFRRGDYPETSEVEEILSQGLQGVTEATDREITVLQEAF